MKLPLLNHIRRQAYSVSQFGGLNQQIVGNPNEYADMKNISTRFYPAIGTREKRGGVLHTLTKCNGLHWKNGLFWVDGTKCYYNGTEISGLDVTDTKKTLVGMGAYIIIFPDKLMYNTADGSVKSMETSFSQGTSMAFEELSNDSAFCKIICAGIDTDFNIGDGVTFEGVNDETFMLGADKVSKTVSDKGSGYIVVTAPIQASKSGQAEAAKNATDSYITIQIDGINDKFNANDYVKITGFSDKALNTESAKVRGVSSNKIIVDITWDAKTTNTTHEAAFTSFYAGSNMTKIACTDFGEKYKENDVVQITGCSHSEYNNYFTVKSSGAGYIVIDRTCDTAFTQASGIGVTRTKAIGEQVVVKRVKFTRASGVSISKSIPDMDYVCEHDNRLWGSSNDNHEIYASKLGDPTNFNCFEGVGTDSYALSVGSDENFTGVASCLGYVIFFKENYIHMMYGNKPANYQLNSKRLYGVREGCSESLQVIDESLYYVGRMGVYRFDGSPVKISDNITEEITDAVSCQQNGKLYISCLLGGEQTLLTYDPRTKIWEKEDSTKFDFASYGEGKLYYTEDNKVKKISGGEENIDWFIESVDLTDSMIMEKYVCKVLFNFCLTAGGRADLKIKYDDENTWTDFGTITSDWNNTYSFHLIPRRCNKYRYRIEGTGEFKLLGIVKYVEGGTELNGTIQH